MTTRYQMKEMPDLQGTGEPITYPKMVMTGQTGTRELAEYIAMTSGFSKGVTEGIICELGEALAHEMGMGRSVKIEGRQRSPAYVEQVTRVWRAAIDSYLANPEGYTVQPEWDKQLLAVSEGSQTTLGAYHRAWQ